MAKTTKGPSALHQLAQAQSQINHGLELVRTACAVYCLELELTYGSKFKFDTDFDGRIDGMQILPHFRPLGPGPFGMAGLDYEDVVDLVGESEFVQSLQGLYNGLTWPDGTLLP